MRCVKRKVSTLRLLLSIWSLALILVCWTSLGFAFEDAQNVQIYAYDFESGWSGWYADNGVWEVGSPGDPGPNAAHSGLNCAGTVLTDVYPNTNSRLVSPSIELPTLGAGEELQLLFWQWAKFGSYDSGQVQVAHEQSPGIWSAWETLWGGHNNTSGIWSLSMVDLSAHAGQKVRIAFKLQQGAASYVNAGWYIDEVKIITCIPVFHQPEHFESGWSGWYADNGVWEVGSPGDPGPNAAHSGLNCAGTVLTDVYPNTNSRLVSPSIELPTLGAGEELQLWFWQWAKFGSYDSGQVQVAHEQSPGIWSAWETLWGGHNNTSGIWSLSMVYLSAHAGQKVRIAFKLQQGAASYVNAGWYIDEVKIITCIPVFHQPEHFESGWSGWYADNGVWEVGSPGDPGPNAAHSGLNCAGTVLTDVYPNTNSRLVSPSIELPTLGAGEELQLWFWQWAKFGSYDSGQVQVAHEQSPGIWSAWETLWGGHNNTSGIWSLSMVDLSAHAGQKVRIAFKLQQGAASYVNAGWYIDEVHLKGPCIDNDGDGYGQFISDFCTYAQIDCNDANPHVNPGQTEIIGNGIDDNCNGRIDENDRAMPWLQLLLLD